MSAMINLGLLSLLSATALAVPVWPSNHAHHHRLTLTSTSTSTSTVTEYVTPSPAAADAAAASQSTITITVQDAYDASQPTGNAPSPAAATAAAAPSEPAAEAAAAITYKPAGKAVVAAAATSAAAAATTAAAAPAGGKRGVAYNDIANTDCFNKGQVSWAYNWGQVAGSGLSSAYEYVPMLWGPGSDFTSNWVSNAKAAVAAGSQHILAFNEPDLAAQSNMDPATAAAAYMTYINDNFAGGSIRLGSPSVTNGAGDMGLTWLSNFLSACTGCQVDFIAIHWYDSATNVDYFKSHVTQAHQNTGKPVWITEFGASGSDDQVNSFLQEVLPWLDAQPFVERYSYFMAKDGLLNTGTELSTYGQTYATFSS